MTTLDFYTYKEDGITYYEFDATECSPPEPMVNTMHALGVLGENEVLRGKFFHEPQPLYMKIEGLFEYEAQALDDGNFLISFYKKI